MQHNFLVKKVETFLQNNEVSKADIWRNIEHLTYLVANKELTLNDAEYCTYVLFKKLEELRKKSAS